MSAKEALATHRDSLAHHQRHLVRKMSHAMSREGLPADLLTESALEPKFCGATGFPEAADSVAYEPTQGLLAVGTSDGRVVLIGQPGVEVTLRSPSRSPTKHLCFLPNKAAVLRVTQDGDCQLFSAVSRRLLTSIWLQGDSINAVTVLPGSDPYVLLGCESGNVRVVALLDESGSPASGAKPAADLALQPYQVLGQEVDGKGGVMALGLAHLRDRPLLLLVHRQSGALVWDIRAERILCTALDAEDEHSKPTCACWVGERANCFAVGYDDGSILVYGVAPEALQGDPFRVVEPPDAQLLMALRVAGRGVHAAAIQSLSCLPGGASGVAEDSLLVFGGQGESEPDMLTLLPLVPQPHGEGGGKQVPWFGNIKGVCTMPAQGALSTAERPQGLLILTEGGQLVVHDLNSWQPTPLTLPIQELPPITVSRLVPTVSMALLAEPGGSSAVSPRSPRASSGATGGGAGSGGGPRPSPRTSTAPASAAGTAHSQALPQHALTLDQVRACSRKAGQKSGDALAGGSSLAEHWPFAGGEPACSMASGRSSITSSGELPSGSTGSAKRHPSALYFTGHRDGRVRVWDATVQVPELLLTVPASAGQERLRAVMAIEVCPFSGILIVGHQGGDVRLYQFTESPQTVHRMNIDETLLPYENVGPQAAGFQYIMRYSTHAADITAVGLATKLKLAAVADESGNVSLLDLLQPAQLFSTRAMTQPVAQLVFGSHLIPGATKEEPGVERVVLFLAGADSSACMLGLDKGEVVGRAMRPKNTSRPLSLALLDASGIPLPLLHGQLVLHWANNNSTSGAAGTAAALGSARHGSVKEDDPALAAAVGRLSRLSISSAPLPLGASRRSTAADTNRSWSRDDPAEPDEEHESPVHVQELPSDDEDDLDSHLAAAVQAVEEEKKAKSKFKLPKAFTRPSSRGQHAAAPHAGAAAGNAAEASLPTSPTSDAGSAATSTATAGGTGGAEAGFDPVGALQEFYGGGAGARAASPDSTILSAGMQSPTDGPQGGQGGNDLLSQVDLVDYPYLIDGDPTPAAYLLLCCEDYLRLYDTDNIRLGDRSTERKASFEAQLCFAAPFMSVHGPGVVSVDASDALQVHSLPGLVQLQRKQLDDSRLLGFRWVCQPTTGMPGGACAATASGAVGGTAASCCSLDGQLILVAPGNEVARLAVVADCALPTAPAAVYSLRLAAAAAVAAAAHRPTNAGGAAAGGFPVRLELPAEAAAAQQKGGGAGDATGAPSPLAAGAKSFGRFFDQAASTVNVLASTAMQEFDRARTVGQTALQRLAAGGAGEAPSRTLPSLAVLFATPVEPLEDDIDYMAESEDAASASSPASSAGASTAASATAAGGGGSSAVASVAQGAVPPARKGSGSLGLPREAAAKLKQLLPKGRTKNERSELLDRDAPTTTATASGASGRGPDGSAGGKDKAVTRTASAIKRAYGRPGATSGATSKAGDVRSIMEENQRMLAERGERLAALDERTAAMQNDAGDFASMARQLAEMQSNKKWYQL